LELILAPHPFLRLFYTIAIVLGIHAKPAAETIALFYDLTRLFLIFKYNNLLFIKLTIQEWVHEILQLPLTQSKDILKILFKMDI